MTKYLRIKGRSQKPLIYRFEGEEGEKVSMWSYRLQTWFDDCVMDFDNADYAAHAGLAEWFEPTVKDMKGV